jgi:hypothetical protein
MIIADFAVGVRNQFRTPTALTNPPTTAKLFPYFNL